MRQKENPIFPRCTIRTNALVMNTQRFPFVLTNPDSSLNSNMEIFYLESVASVNLRTWSS